MRQVNIPHRHRAPSAWKRLESGVKRVFRMASKVLRVGGTAFAIGETEQLPAGRRRRIENG
jgi:hypothetical protein